MAPAPAGRTRRGWTVALGAGVLLVISMAAWAQSKLAATPDPFIRTWARLAETDTHLLGGGKGKVNVLLHSATGIGSAAMSRLRGEAGFAVPEHVHEASDELLYVLSGGGTMRLDGRSVDVEPDMALWIPRGRRHSFTAGPEGIDAIQVYSPGGPEQRFLAAPKAR